MPKKLTPSVRTSLYSDTIAVELDQARQFVEAKAAERLRKGKATLGDQATKKNFAQGLSTALATRFADALRERFPQIWPNEEGHHESRARTVKTYKKLDVNYSTSELGLALGVSIKTINFRDGESGRYTKNQTRVDAELRAEASDYHERQPYAVMIGIVFLPWDACDDGSPRTPSSFGEVVQTMKFRAGRRDAKDSPALFERVFIGLYKPNGDVRFFDVTTPPPKWGAPSQTLAFQNAISEIVATYDDRNHPRFVWADGEVERVTPPAASEELSETASDDDA